MKAREFLSKLEKRCDRVGLDLSPELGSRLIVYFELLAFWNRKMNLAGFALDNPSAAALDRLFVEPLVVATHLETFPPAMIDIGSGGGSPAVPMILALRPRRAVLVESRSRKSTFLREVLRQLDLSSTATVEESRFESLATNNNFVGQFELLTVRAVRVAADELAEFVRPGGTLVQLGRSAAAQSLLFATSEPISFNETGEEVGRIFRNRIERSPPPLFHVEH